MSKFKVGDVVQLKSGGPYMTIHNIGSYADSGGPENGANCIWFSKDIKDNAVFDVDALVKVE